MDLAEKRPNNINLTYLKARATNCPFILQNKNLFYTLCIVVIGRVGGKKNMALFNPWKELSCNDNVWNHILWGCSAKTDRKF